MPSAMASARLPVLTTSAASSPALTATVVACDEHNAIIPAIAGAAWLKGNFRSRRGHSEEAYRDPGELFPSVANCAKDNCTNEFEFQNKLAASLSELTIYFVDAFPAFSTAPQSAERCSAAPAAI